MFYYLLSKYVICDNIFGEYCERKVEIGLYSSLSALKEDVIKDLDARYSEYEDYEETMHNLRFEIDSIEENDIDLETSAEIDSFEIIMVKVIK